MALYAIQKLKIDDDEFSFGSSYLSGLISLIVVIAVFGTVAFFTVGVLRWVALGFMALAILAGLPKFLIGSMQNKWLLSWGANAQGVLIRHNQSHKFSVVDWNDVYEIKLIEHFVPKAQKGQGDSPRKKAVLIELKELPEPSGWIEKIERMVPSQTGLPHNVVLKSYGGSTSDEVAKLIQRYAPASLAIHKIGKQVAGQIISSDSMNWQ